MDSNSALEKAMDTMDALRAELDEKKSKIAFLEETVCDNLNIIERLELEVRELRDEAPDVEQLNNQIAIMQTEIELKNIEIKDLRMKLPKMIVKKYLDYETLQVNCSKLQDKYDNLLRKIKQLHSEKSFKKDLSMPNSKTLVPISRNTQNMTYDEVIMGKILSTLSQVDENMKKNNSHVK